MQGYLAIKKAVKRFFKRGIARLPAWLRDRIVRRLLRFNPDWSSRENDNLVVRFAQTADEIGKALELVREVYIERGFMKPQDPRVVSKYLFADSTRLVVAMHKDIVVGCLTLVQHHNPFGLPLERVFTIPATLAKSGNLVEVTGLGITRDYRREMQSSCLFLLMAFLYRYASARMNATALMVTCLPRDTDFYRSILLFQPMDGVSYCDDYLGYPADCVVLNLTDASERFAAVYAGKKIDMHDYLGMRPHRQLDMTERPGPSRILADDETRIFLRDKWGYSYPAL